MVLKNLKWTLLICCTVFFNCTDYNDEIKVYPIDSKLTPFLFDTGSWWAYKNTATFQTDTDMVVFAKRGYQNAGGSGSGRYTFLAWNMGFKNLKTKKESYYIVTHGAWWYSFLEKALLVDYTHQEADSNNVNLFHRQMQLLDSMRINGRLYRNIRRVRVEEYPDSATNTYNQYFIADSIGIIRWDQYNKGVNTDSKFLIDYRIKLAPNWNSP